MRPTELHDRRDGEGYAAALGGHLLGLALGGGVGLLLAMLTVEGDPNAGAANLSLAFVVGALVIAVIAVTAPLGCYLMLRWRRYGGAASTGWWTLGLFLGSVALSLGFAPIFFVGLIWSPLLARRLVLRKSKAADRPGPGSES